MRFRGSSLERRALCPGSARLEEGQPDQTSPEAEFGSHIAEYLSGGRDEDAMTPQEIEVGHRLLDRRNKILADWVAAHDGTMIHPIHCAREFEYRVEREGYTLTGRPDVVFRTGDNRHALIIDEKSISWSEQTSAAENLQLRCYSVLLVAAFPQLETVQVVINQDGHATDSCVYHRWDLDRAAQDIDAICRAALAPDAPLVPGEVQCRWCRARSFCPALNGARESLAPVLPTKIEAEKLALGLSNKQIAELLPLLKPVEYQIDALREEAKRRIEAGESIEGWQLKAGIERRTVTDLGTVTARLEALGCTWPDITAACSIALKNVEGLVRGATGEKGKGLREMTSAVLDGCVEVKATVPSLVRTNERIEG